MKGVALLLTALLFVKGSVADQTYPGTANRPILSDDEAAKYTRSNYFSGWEPEDIVIPTQPDYTVKSGGSIQAVVNEAIKNGSPDYRTYILIEAGMYMETVYLKGNIPLTIYGGGATAADVHIMATLSGDTTTADYKNAVNPDGTRYQEGDPAWSIYNACANQQDIIGPECSAVFSIETDGLQLQGVTVHNGATDGQAIAVKTSADKLHLMNNNFRGVQDTLAVGIAFEDLTKVARVFIHMCTIEGEIDYVTGAAATVFEMTTFNVVATRTVSEPIIFAPDTSPDRSYGFLVINSNITGDASYQNTVKLGRAWDHGVRNASAYQPGESPNGQLVIRDTNIDGIINVDAPYTAAAASNRPFSTDISTDRDLDDNTHNRLWEYKNSGSGA